MGQERSAPVGSLDRWCKRAERALAKFKAIPTAMRVVLICIAVLAVFSVTNLVYQILHKPTEVFALIPGEPNKAPIETWRQYAPLFREYSTISIPPELLAALAPGGKCRQSHCEDLLAVESDLRSVRGLPTCFERCWHVPDDRRRIVGGGTLLHSPPYRRRDRLFRDPAPFSGRATPRHRTHRGVLGPQRRSDSWPPSKDENQPSAKGGTGRGHSSVWHRTSDGICAPRLPPH